MTSSNSQSKETIITNIACTGLTIDENESLYVVDNGQNEVRRYRRGQSQGTVVADCNGSGNRLDQLSCPYYAFVDRDHSVYVSDSGNDRVMKWMKGAKQGLVVAGGQGRQSSQLNQPVGLSFDRQSNLYVVDWGNHRVKKFNIDSI